MSRRSAKRLQDLERLASKPQCDPEAPPTSQDPRLLPLVDRARCEGKSDCLDACPFDVFEVRRMDDADFAQLGLLAKLKSLAHGRKSAYTVRSDGCRACGMCVVACPEDAIKLVRATF